METMKTGNEPPYAKQTQQFVRKLQ